MTLPSYDSAIATYTYFDLTRHGSRGHTLWPPNRKGLILTYKSQKVSKWKLPNLEKKIYIYIFCIYTLTLHIPRLPATVVSGLLISVHNSKSKTGYMRNDTVIRWDRYLAIRQVNRIYFSSTRKAGSHAGSQWQLRHCWFYFDKEINFVIRGQS